MKRYLVFCFNRYYPGGGAEDFVGDFAQLDFATAALEAAAAKPDRVYPEGHVWDSWRKRFVARLDSDERGFKLELESAP